MVARTQLPMHSARERFVETVRRNPVTVVHAPTGAGKTTLVPLMLLDAGFVDAGQIGITQPRRIAAISVAGFVAELHGSELGDAVGYQIKGESALSRSTCVKFMTVGILLREFGADPLLRKYGVIVLDEAHERSIHQDVLAALIRAILRRRPSLKFVIMSATIDAAKFAAHFGGAPVVSVQGRLFPVEMRYATSTPYSLRQCMDVCAETVQEIVRRDDRGDVLVFLPDEDSIRGTERRLSQMRLDGALVLPLFGAQSAEEQRRVFRLTARRRIILATNIAETSVTIDGVVHVVDSGFVKQMQYVGDGMSALTIVPHSQSGCDQRAGRAGRTQAGICHRLFTEGDFAERPEFTEPEIQRTALDQVLLQQRVHGRTTAEVKALEFMDPPAAERWDDAEQHLRVLGALDAQGAVTVDGRRMERLPVAPMLGRMLLEAERRGCLTEVATVVAGFTARPVFLKPKKDDDAERAAYETAHVKLQDDRSDALTLLKVWEAWIAAGENGERDQWAREHHCSARALRDIERDRDHLLRECERLGLSVTASTDHDAVRKAIAAGCIMNLARAGYRFSYAWHDRDDVFIHPSSALFGRPRRAQLLVCAEVVETSKAFARQCTEIEAAWIPELLPVHLLERTWEIDAPSWCEAPRDVGLIEVCRWQGMELSRRVVDPFPAEAIPLLVDALLSEALDRGRGTLHSHAIHLAHTWKAIRPIVDGGAAVWGFSESACTVCPALAQMRALLRERLAGVTTMAEFRRRDCRIFPEDVLTPEQLAQHEAVLAAERARAAEEQRIREMRTAFEDERRRQRQEELRPLCDRASALRDRLVGLTGSDVASVQYRLGELERSLQWSFMEPRELERTLAALEVRTAVVESEQRESVALATLAWDAVLAAFPVCPLCGSTWSPSPYSPRELRCTQAHDARRVLHGTPHQDGSMLLARFMTDRDEEAATVVLWTSGTVSIQFRRARTHVWDGKKFKEVQWVSLATLLPPELAEHGDTIRGDLAEFERMRQEVAGFAQREREFVAKRGKVLRLTFHEVDGQMVADQGTTRYHARFQECYPAAGETWICAVGYERGLGKRYIDAEPLLKVAVRATDLQELRELLLVTYPGLPESAIQMQ